MSDQNVDTRTHDKAHDPALRSRSAFDLIRDAIDQMTFLVRNEVDLARAEMNENLKKAMAAIGMLVAAVVLFLVALNVLAAALVAWIAETGLDAGWAALIVGGGIIILALILLSIGKKNLSATSLAPTRTSKNVKRDVRTIKENTTHG